MILTSILFFTGIAMNRMKYLYPTQVSNIRIACSTELPITNIKKEKNDSIVIEFTRDIPTEFYGHDCRNVVEDAARLEKIFKKYEILSELESDTLSESQKLEFIRQEFLEIYGETTICGINPKTLYIGFEEFDVKYKSRMPRK